MYKFNFTRDSPSLFSFTTLYLKDLIMKKLVLLTLSLIIFVAPAFAKSHKSGSQQTKMTACNKEAGEKNLAGDARKDFMKTCLSSHSAAPAAKALTPQQQKMKDCNKNAGDQKLKGAPRKQFMKECLSK
jgi:hypothetical protein